MLKILAALCFLAATTVAGEPPRGFQALFDGKSLEGFEVSENAKDHWRVENGVLRYDGKETHLWTKRSYRDTVLRVDWRIPQPGARKPVDDILLNGDVAKDASGHPKKVEIDYGGDSGIYLRGNDKSQVNIWNWPIGSGEVWGYRTDPNMPPEIRAGVTPRSRADKPLGEWNTFMILMKGDRLSVDLNGVNVISRAKLPGVPRDGKIALQSHGDPMEFREIYLRELPEEMVELFNGENLDGWRAVGAEKETWSVRDGKLICTGKPHGFLRTEKEQANFSLEGEWMFAGKGGQSGLLLHTHGEEKVWPPSIEVQLDHGVIGNFIKIGDVSFDGGKRSEDMERPVGRWNHFEVICRGDTIETFMNGKKVSEARKCSPTKGAIAFQSEGVEVHFRNIWLRRLGE
jgi:hypothetical protein